MIVQIAYDVLYSGKNLVSIKFGKLALSRYWRTFNLAIFTKFTKLKTLLKFPAIRYILVSYAIIITTVEGISSVRNPVHVTSSNMYVYLNMHGETCMLQLYVVHIATTCMNSKGKLYVCIEFISGLCSRRNFCPR